MIKKTLFYFALVLIPLYIYSISFPINQVTIEINAPVGQVWEYITVEEKLKLWLDGLISSKKITHDDLKVGTQTIETVGIGGNIVELLFTCVEFTKEQSVRFLIENKDFHQLQTYMLTKVSDNKTILNMRAVAYMNNLFEKLLTPLIILVSNQKMNTDFAKLKSILETK